MTTLLQKLEQQAMKRGLEKFSKESLDWYRKTASRLVKGEGLRTKFIKDQKQRAKELRDTTLRPGIGKMYSFVYDAKHKDTLPYWDAFPLIFFLAPTDSGFYGINLHLLPPAARAKLLDRLMEFANNKRYDERTKLRLSYELLASSTKLSLFRPCFRQYLWSHVRTKFLKIDASEWEAALFLPIADFQGATEKYIWKESLLRV